VKIFGYVIVPEPQHRVLKSVAKAADEVCRVSVDQDVPRDTLLGKIHWLRFCLETLKEAPPDVL
jgi:hypothetical protein